MSLRIIQMYQSLFIWVVNSLELESQKSHLEHFLVFHGDTMFAFSSDFSEECLQILAILIDKLMGFLKTYSLYAF